MFNKLSFIKVRQTLIFVVGLFCLAILAGTLLKVGLTKQSSQSDGDALLQNDQGNKIIKKEDLEDVVSEAIKFRGTSYAEGEITTEGHVILTLNLFSYISN